MAVSQPIEILDVSAYRFPTAATESDGTLEWSSTTLVLVVLEGAGRRGLGYTYADTAAVELMRRRLAPLVVGADVLSGSALLEPLRRSVRNIGHTGVAAYAISAIDIALWDLKARVLEVPLAALLGRARPSVPVYGSGGFTSYSKAELAAELGGWASEGIRAVKMKVGRRPDLDASRVEVARRAIGPNVDLYVDANGALDVQQASRLADAFARQGVSWFEEPVSAEDPDGLRFLREHLPSGMRVVAGEYCTDPASFLRLLRHGAVDVHQADATRCGGITGFLAAAALCQAWEVPFSSHTAPSIHLHPCCAVAGRLEPMEYFVDHVRIEHLVFDGAATARDGVLIPAEGSPGLGLTFRPDAASKFRVA